MAYRTIKLKKYSDVIEEYVAAGTITPGMLLEFNSDGKVEAHSDAGGSAFPMFALEDELQGKGIDDDYAADDRVQCWIPGRGDQVYALLTGSEVVKGQYLQSAGDGTLEALAGGGMVVGQALEAVNPASAAVRLKVRIV